MSGHCSSKSLAFYGLAIASVTTLFYLTSAYGEANLQAPRRIDGRYQVSMQNPPECLKSDSLLLIVQQSDIFLTGTLLSGDTSPGKVEGRPLLTGRWNNQQLTLQGTVNPCPEPINIQGRFDEAPQSGKTDLAKLSGTLDFNVDPGVRPSVPFIALRGCVRTLELEREWGLCPQPGVPPLHPVLTIMTTAILPEKKQFKNHQKIRGSNHARPGRTVRQTC
ncbi:hypothetical protein [Leptothermofonsia sp. ETS-13]|uniref:hypothetical protein n=1 Tax=Leptothermofonsia sp. ETS-13 TaxID=3035696 RepID=UPI003B9E5A64